MTTRVSELQEIFTSQFPLFSRAIERGLATFGPSWGAQFEETLNRVFPTPAELSDAANAYALFAIDMMRRQRTFEQDRRYPDRSYQESMTEVYLDTDFMSRQYLPALLLSHYLWPHHYQQANFFTSAFVSTFALSENPEFIEVGVGTGIHSRWLLRTVSTARGIGVDVSQASLDFAARHVSVFDVADRYDTRLLDVLEDDLAPVPWIICVEVIEHLEDPLVFLHALRRLLAPGGHAFITTALNAAHVDHIYLYETSEQVIDQLGWAGFTLEEAFLANAYAPRKQGLPVPAVAAFIVT